MHSNNQFTTRAATTRQARGLPLIINAPLDKTTTRKPTPEPALAITTNTTTHYSSITALIPTEEPLTAERTVAAEQTR